MICVYSFSPEVDSVEPIADMFSKYEAVIDKDEGYFIVTVDIPKLKLIKDLFDICCNKFGDENVSLFFQNLDAFVNMEERIDKLESEMSKLFQFTYALQNTIGKNGLFEFPKILDEIKEWCTVNEFKKPNISYTYLDN